MSLHQDRQYLDQVVQNVSNTENMWVCVSPLGFLFLRKKYICSM